MSKEIEENIEIETALEEKLNERIILFVRNVMLCYALTFNGLLKWFSLSSTMFSMFC
jgi:hypothetical protein